MTNSEHVSHFAGKTVRDWEEDKALEDWQSVIYRISIDYSFSASATDSWTDRFAKFLQDPHAHEITGLVVGVWDLEPDAGVIERVIEAITSAHTQLPHLTALFLGDITYEENEISWIEQGDVSPIFAAYPQLEHFRVRGGNGLVLGKIQHPNLKSLIIESGGLPVSVVEDVLRSELPALEHLELWLGATDYGATTTVADLAPLLSGQLFPNLRYLGLRDSELTNDIAVALTRSPLLERIHTLDLSLGLLDDTGATALLTCPAIRRLESLDIHHHYCTETVIEQLKQLGIPIDASEPQLDNGREWRFVAVGE